MRIWLENKQDLNDRTNRKGHMFSTENQRMLIKNGNVC